MDTVRDRRIQARRIRCRRVIIFNNLVAPWCNKAYVCSVLTTCMGENHTDDLRNVVEGDTVEIVTTEDESFEAECTDYRKEHADPRTGEVRETSMWTFEAVEYKPVATITDGLRSSDTDPEFPIHTELWDQQQEGHMGYIDDISIHGNRNT